MTQIQPRGFEPITQYLSHHNNDYHDMPVGNLIGITNVCHATADEVLAEFDRQRDQLAQVATVDVTELGAFHAVDYSEAGAIVAGDFQNATRTANFFLMLNQAREQYLALSHSKAMRIVVIAADHNGLTIRLTASGVTVDDAESALATYVHDVIVDGYHA